MLLIAQNRVAPGEVLPKTKAGKKIIKLMMCCVYECACNKIKVMDTCNSVIQPLIPLLQPKLVWHNSRYNCARTALPQLYAAVCIKSRSSGRKHRWTCTHFLSANKKNPISTTMKPRALRSKVTSSVSGAEANNWSYNHRMEIADPFRASACRMTPSSSRHNSATSNTHVPVTAGPWIRSLRMIATSYNVVIISPMGT